MTTCLLQREILYFSVFDNRRWNYADRKIVRKCAIIIHAKTSFAGFQESIYDERKWILYKNTFRFLVKIMRT